MTDPKLMTIMVRGNLLHDIEKCDGCQYLSLEHQTTLCGNPADKLMFVPDRAIIPSIGCNRYTGDDRFFIEEKGKTLLPCEMHMPCSNKPVGWRPRGEKYEQD